MTKPLFRNILTTLFFVATALAVGAQGVCTQFVYYYADINYPAGGTETDVYSVSLQDGEAILNPITEDIPGEHHMAYNEMDQLIYMIEGANGTVRILDPGTGSFIGDPIPVSPNVSNVTTAAFSAEGDLLIGAGNGTIFIVDLDSSPAPLSVYSEDNDISGGDITFDASGQLYLAAKPQGKFYEVIPGFANEQLGNVDGQVTGMATLENGTGFIVSSRTNTQFLTYEIVDGELEEAGAFDAVLATGEPFTLENGDMSSGCAARSTSIEGCEDFRTYYMEDAVGGGADKLYTVEFNGMGGADLTEIGQFPGGSHVGLGPNGLLYIVRFNTGMMTVWDPLTQSEVYQVQITNDGEDVDAIPAVVVGDDGFVYVGSQDGDLIYRVNPVTGEAVVFGEGDVSGGDLIFAGGALWVANRSQNTFFEINGTGEFEVAATEINGVANLPDGNLLISNGNLNGLFEVYEPITGNATGEVFETGLELFNGDLASRCFDGNQNFEDCADFRTYFIHTPLGDLPGALYEVELTDLGTTNLSVIRELGDSHLGLGPDGLLYVVKNNGNLLTIIDPETNVSVDIDIVDENGDDLGNVPAVVVADDGTLYVGVSSENKIYTVDTNTGLATFYADANVNGGDLVIVGGDLWVATRNNSTFTNVDNPGSFTVAADEILGVSVLPDGNLLVADGDLGSVFEVYEPITGNFLGEYETGLELYWGDLASRCFDGNPNEDECDNYNMFLAANGSQGGDLYSFSFDETGGVDLNLLREDLGQIHIGYDESNGLVYLVKGNTGEVAIYDPIADVLSAFTNIAMGSMEIPNTFSAVVIDSGELLVGSGPLSAIYSVDPVTGEATFYAEAPVSGGDLVQTNDGNVWVVNRSAGGFYNVSDDGATTFAVDLEGMYGALIMEDGGILVGSDGDELSVVEPTATGGLSGTVYTLPFSFSFGDLAAGCGDNYSPSTMENVAEVDYSLTSGPDEVSIATYPNPTDNFANIHISTEVSERAAVEVFDMSGRSVVTLLNQEVQAGEDYTLRFDGSMLPNGIYIVKYVSPRQTITEKIMIAR